jgi:hypothetical protein
MLGKNAKKTRVGRKVLRHPDAEKEKEGGEGKLMRRQMGKGEQTGKGGQMGRNEVEDNILRLQCLLWNDFALLTFPAKVAGGSRVGGFVYGSTFGDFISPYYYWFRPTLSFCW